MLLKDKQELHCHLDKEGRLAMDLICENSEERGLLVRPEEASQFHQMTSQHIIFGLKFRPYILLLRERERDAEKGLFFISLHVVMCEHDDYS